MAKYIADSLYIASIYPGELEPVRRNYGPSRQSTGKGAERSTCFRLTPIVRGSKPGYCIIEVTDSFEDVIDLSQIQNSTAGSVHKPKALKPVPVETIVADVLAIWTGGLFNVPQGAKPGIMQIAGTVPTQNELREMTLTQTLYFEYLFAEGERLDQQKDWKDITGVMRLAAEWLGHRRAWSHRAIAADSSPCPICTAMVPNAAYVCPSCGKVIRALPAELAALQAMPAHRA